MCRGRRSCAFVGSRCSNGTHKQCNGFAGSNAVVRSRCEVQPWPEIKPARGRAREREKSVDGGWQWSGRGNDENVRILCSTLVVRLSGPRRRKCVKGSGERDAALTLARKSVSDHVARTECRHGRLKECRLCRGCQVPMGRIVL